MNTSIATRLVIIVVLLVSLSAGTISLYLYHHGIDILTQNALNELSHNIQRDGGHFTDTVEELRRDVLYLSETPPIPGLIRALKNNNYDPLGQSSKEQWLKRYTSLSRSLLATNPAYTQVRLLRANGREWVKIFRDNGEINIIKAASLQDKSHSNYYKQSRKLRPGEFYFSPINLNREFGKISLPHTPVLRCATPVYDGNKLFAIVIINLDVSYLMKHLESLYLNQSQTIYVTNSQGAYLSHPDPDRRYGIELGHYYRIQEDYPILARLYASGNKETRFQFIPDDNQGKILVFVKLPFIKQKPDEFVGIALTRNLKQIVAEESKALQHSAVIVVSLVVLSILLAAAFGNLLVRPLKQIAASLQGFQRGDVPKLPIKRKDEIGVLSRALYEMADNVFSSHQELRTLNANLEDEVEARTQEVHQHFKTVNAINQAQELFIRESNPRNAFQTMLSSLLESSESEFGFIGEVLLDEKGRQYLRIYVTTNIAWDEATQQFYDDNFENGLEFRELDNLFGQVVLTGETIISNKPADDPRSKGIPPGHPEITSFLGIPLHHNNKLIGMVAIANRAQDYDEDTIHSIKPFLNTCANMILSCQTRLAAETSALALSEARSDLERVTNISPVIFYVIRAYGDYSATFVSPNVEHILGYTDHECLNDPEFWRENIHPDDRQQALENQKQIFETGHLEHSYRFRKKSGNYIWVYDDLQLIRDEDGEPKEIAGYWLDITQRKQAEQNLVQNERELSTILDNLPLMMFLKNADDLCFSRFNRAGEELLGLSRNDLIGKSDYDFFPKEQADFFTAKDREVLKNCNTIEIQEEPILTPRGERILHTRKTVITDSEGKPLYLLGLSEDITEAKQTQDELARFKSTLDQTQDCVFMYSSDTLQYFYVNQGACFLVGYSNEELLNMHPFDLNTQFSNEQEFRDFIKPLISKQKPSLNFETEYRCKDNSLVPVEVILQYISHDDQNPRFIAMVRDITERRKVDRIKNEFISTVSHELRTPLTSIRGSLGLMLGGATGEIPPALEHMLRIANNNAERLLLLINDLLDIQKIESGQMDFELKPIDVMALIEQAVENNAAYADQYKVMFVIKNETRDAQLLGDQDRLLQVLSNLMSNAAKFSPENSSVELAAEVKNGNVLISVTDFGEGIPEEFQPSLFDRFTQYDSSDTRQKGGTGLGLSIVKAIMDKHQGKIDYVTAQGKGTTMIIQLPLYSLGRQRAS